MAQLAEHFDHGVLGITLTTVPQKWVGINVGKKVAIVAGAQCVWDDVFALGIQCDEFQNGYEILCVNDIVMHFPGRVDHLYSNDHRMFPYWLGARRRQYQKKKFGTITTHSCQTGGQVTWPWPGHGTSALGAVYTALAMGYDKIVLCGVPLDNSGWYHAPPWYRSNFEREVAPTVDGQLSIWTNARRAFKNRVYSMSGRTKELLGEP